MKFFPSYCMLVLAGLCSLYTYHMLQRQSWSQADTLLRHVLHGISKQVAQDGFAEKKWSALINPTAEINHLRLTIIDANGKVIADNHGNPEQMDNHLLRPEIKEACESPNHTGQSKRVSRSIGTDYYYLAEAFYSKHQLLGVVRLAMPMEHIVTNVTASFFIIIAPLSVLLLFMGIRWQCAHNTSSNIAHSDTAKPIDNIHGSTPNNKDDATIRALHATQAKPVIWQEDRAFNLAAMLNSLNEGIIAVNHDEQVVYVNKAAADILQQQEEQILGQSIWDISRIHSIPESIHKCLRNPEPIQQQFQILRQHKQVNFLLQVTPVFQASELTHEPQPIYAAIAILDDISDQQRIEGLRRNFFTSISHELKTPLAVIKGIIETMLDDRSMPEHLQVSFLNKASKQSMRLGKLVGDILTISRLEDHENFIEKEPVSLTHVLRETVTSLQNRAEQKHISLRSQIPSDPCTIDGDRELLQQVFDNLLSNAINYSPQNSIVSIVCEIKAHEYVISVADNGPGIPPLAQERIFERFFRVDKARSRQVGGTGLGLAIAKHATAVHGGSISVRSEIAKGSTFIVHIPKSPKSAAHSFSSSQPTHS